MKLRVAVRVWLVVALAVALAACGRGSEKAKEIAYVAAQQVILRDRLATVYNQVGTVSNGERVEVLETRRRFARVRTARGEEGWLEQRHLVSQEVFDGFGKLARDHATAPVQAQGIARAGLNMHLAPDRDADHLYQLKEGERVEVIKRATAEKPQPRMATPDGKEPPKAYEDWWLVRDAQKHAGWVLGRMVDIDAPLEVAQYAEGQRIVAYFVLNQVQDGDKKVAQYLLLFTEPRDGLPFDFNQARIFTWNVRRHRYETAYRERKLAGMLPATVGHEAFPREGDLPTFTLRVQDENGQLVERKYKLNGPIVRRVLSPEEQARSVEQFPPAASNRKRR